jgi:thiamine-monophosphate kinase
VEEEGSAYLVRRQQVPEPRVQLGRYLACNHADVAMIDISDSLFNELQLLAAASHLGFDINVSAVPLYPGVEHYARTRKLDSQRYAMFSGEEYELLFCCAAPLEELQRDLDAAGIVTPIALIGTVTAGEVVFRDSHGNPMQLNDETFRHMD